MSIMQEKRNVICAFPRGILKLELFGGTDDAVCVRIFKANSNKPFVRYHGKQYYLTPEEISDLRVLQSRIRAFVVDQY